MDALRHPDAVSMLIGGLIFLAGFGLRALYSQIDRRLTDKALKETRADEQQRLREWLQGEADNAAKLGEGAPQRVAATYRMLADRIAPNNDRTEHR